MPEPITAVARRSSIRRGWIPLLVILLAGGLLFGVWSERFFPEMPQFARVAITDITALTTIFLLVLWFLLLSGVAWRVRLAALVVLAGIGGAVVAAVRRVEFSGDMVPIAHFRWEKTTDEVLEAARQERPRATVSAAAPLAGTEPGDFPEYRGRGRDGVVAGPALALNWKTNPPRVVWRRPIGGGYAQVVIAGPLAVTIEQRRAREAVVAYDVATGAEVWVYDYPAAFSEAMGGDGPRATPTIADGQVYSLGAAGNLACLNAADGKPLWSHNILVQSGENLQWGMSGSPLVYEDVVVVNPGVNKGGSAGNALVAYDRKSGAIRWHAGDHYAGYSSPQLATLAGQPVLLLFDGDGFAIHDPKTGHELGRYPWATHERINVAQPLVLPEDRILISSGYGRGSSLLKVAPGATSWTFTERWKKVPNPNLRCRFTSPVAYQGFVYGLDEGILVCLDLTTGERRWKGGRYGNGQILLLGDRIIVQQELGGLALVRATPTAFEELGQFPILTGKTWNCPALAHGKLFVRNQRELACLELVSATAE